MRVMRLVLCLAASVVLAGCIGMADDIGSERNIVGRFRLKAWEDGAFYLRRPSDRAATMPDDPVQRIGWDDAHVLVLRGQPDVVPSWTVIDVATDVARVLPAGPGADTSLGRTPLMPSDSAWQLLQHR